MEIAAFIILAIIVVILGISLIKARYPNSTVAKDVGAAEVDIEAARTKLEEFTSKATTDLRSAAAPIITKVELGVGTELSKLLGEIETRLTDTSGEDAAIVVAQQYLARVTAEVQASIDTANAQKAEKLTALQSHIATLTAAAAPVAVVNAGPAA